MMNRNQGRLRVAIQLDFNSNSVIVEDNDNDIITNNNNNSHYNNNADVETSASLSLTLCRSPPLLLYQSLRVIDHQTLNIKVKPGMAIRQQFDFVCNAADDALNAEMFRFLDDLLLFRRDCRLLFFDGQFKGRNMISLFKLIIAEVNLRLGQLKATISRIKLFYLKSDYEQEEEYGGMTSAVHLNGHRVCHFHNTWDLLKWVLNVFRLGRSVETAYESLDINFRIKVTADTDLDTREIFDIRLAIFNVYFNKIDDSRKKELYDFIKPTADRPLVTNADTKMKTLLRFYLKEEAEESCLLLCNIPSMKCSKSNAFLLAIAIRVYDRFTKEENQTRSKRSSLNPFAVMEISHDDTPPPPKPMPKSRAVCFHIPFNEHILRKRCLSQKAYSGEDLNQLGNWYIKIDEIFTEAKALMETYYARKYKRKSEQLCDDIQLMSRGIDFNNSKLESNSGNTDEEKLNTDEVLQSLYDKCKRLLQKTSNELESSNFAENLKIYFYTKNFSFSQHILRFQIEQLEGCRQRLNEVLDEELEVLNSMLFKKEELMD